MIIEFHKGPGCIDFAMKADTENFKGEKLKNLKKTKEGINFTYKDKNILIPWTNIVAIEENDGK